MQKWIKEFELEKETVTNANTTYTFRDNNNTVIEGEDVEIKNTLRVGTIDLHKLIVLYEATLTEIKSLSSNVRVKEIEIAKPYWTGKTLSYFGGSIFYQRENINVFQNNTAESFDDLFTSINGDLFGGTLSINFFKQNKKTTVFYRVLYTAARISNTGNFTQNVYSIEQVSSLINNENVTIEQSQEAYASNNNTSYTYGTNSNIAGEVYLFYKNFGVFGQLAFDGTYFDFENTKINDIEKVPMRLGALFNLKSNDNSKNILTMQIFVDRSDITIDPTPSKSPDNDDWRFGFKIGLPINITKGI